MTLSRGLYDLVLTEAVARSLENIAPDVAHLGDFDNADATERLIEVLGRQLRSILDHLDDGGEGRAHTQLALVNDLLSQLRADRRESEDLIDPVEIPPRVLRAIHGPGQAAPEAPETGLAAPWLFTAGRGSPSLLNELRREAGACDQIDILVSFITVSGVRKLIDVLRSATAGNAAGEGRTRICVLTTTYTGATEIEALDELARLNGCEAKVSLDGRRTRLHA